MAFDPQSVFLCETVTKQMLLLQSREAIQLLSMLTESTVNKKLPLLNPAIFSNKDSVLLNSYLIRCFKCNKIKS